MTDIKVRIFKNINGKATAWEATTHPTKQNPAQCSCNLKSHLYINHTSAVSCHTCTARGVVSLDNANSVMVKVITGKTRQRCRTFTS